MQIPATDFIQFLINFPFFVSVNEGRPFCSHTFAERHDFDCVNCIITTIATAIQQIPANNARDYNHSN